MEFSTLFRLSDAKVHAIEVDPATVGDDHFLMVAPFSKTIDVEFEVVRSNARAQFRVTFRDTMKVIERRQIDQIRGLHLFDYKGDRYVMRVLANREHDP